MTTQQENIELRLLPIVRQFLKELDHERALRNVTLNASIEKDLGFDSLGKVELFHRIERGFSIELHEATVIEVETLSDLIKAIEKANPPRHYFSKEFSPVLEKSDVDASKAETLVEVLLLFGKEAPERPHIRLQEQDGTETIITYGDLLKNAIKIAKGLLAKGIRLSETVSIMLPTSKEFFYSFFGVLLAGAIPVPLYPPFRPDKIEEYARRESTILNNAETRVLITFEAVETLGKILRTLIPSLHFVTTAEDLMNEDGEFTPPNLSSDDAALIQYTSGSTGLPKGVQLSHHCLLSNIRGYGKAVDVQPTDIVVSWLPLYHDMGLIGAWLGSLYYGLPLILMSPLAFLTRPERWLWAIHYHRATLSAGPNFAYELAIRKVDETLIEGLDLSCWRLACNGAEAILPNTLERFAKKFKPYGFKRESLFPVYGLAESSVALLFPPLGRGPWIDKIDRSALEERGEAISFESSNTILRGGNNHLEFVSCGKPMEGHAVRIVNEYGQALGERIVGNLQFTGPSSLQGYYRNPEATKAIYHDGWWDTGDLAYQAEGEIFITGRKKDVIIKAGRNLYPEGIEAITATVEGIRKGCVVAFGVPASSRGTEKLIVVAESRTSDQNAKDEMASKIIEKVVIGTGVPPDHVVIVPPRTIGKTSSGKLQRSTTKSEYLKGKLARHRLPMWFQMIKLFMRGSRKSLAYWVKRTGRFIYAAYVALILLLTGIPTWLMILIFPRSMGQKVTKSWARLLLFLVGCPLKVKGRENIPKKTAIFAANHTSYVDAVILIAVLPLNTAFIAKRELLRVPIVKTFLKRLGQMTVERMEFTQSISDARKISQAVKSGQSLALFPEGTFTYATGLRPFKMGAFKIAVDSNTPICPVSLKGARQVLRSDSCLPRPGKIEVTISPLIYPEGSDWEAISKLRTLTRTEIAKYCGEYPIDLIASGPLS